MGCGCRRRRRFHGCDRCGGHRDHDGFGGFGGFGGSGNCFTTKHWRKVCKCVPFHKIVCEAPAFDGFDEGGDDGFCGHRRHRHHHCHKKC